MVSTVLLATDSDHLAAEVDATLASDDCTVLRVRNGADVLPVARVHEPELILLDLQIGAMGGIATALSIRQQITAGRFDHRPVALLLDREADTFLAAESGCEGWLVKPLDSLRLRKLFRALMAQGGTFHEGRREQTPAG